MGKDVKKRRTPNVNTDEPKNKPIRVKFWPPEIEGDFGKVTAILIGLFLGATLLSIIVYKFHQPSFVLKPAIKEALKNTPTPTPSPIMAIKDANTSQQILPTDRQYTLSPGQEVKLEFTPNDRNLYKWTFVPPEIFKKCVPSIPTGAQINCIASDTEIELSVVKACVVNEQLECAAGLGKDALIRINKKDR